MRREFSRAVMAAAADRAKGHCEQCTRKLLSGDFHFDHVIPDALGGEPTLENCAVLCRACHAAKTTKGDVPRIAKMKRQRDTALGIRKTRTPIKGWRRFNGDPVRNPRA